MATRSSLRTGSEVVTRLGTPVKSITAQEARRAVLASYKRWMRYAPTVWWEHRLRHMPMGTFKLALKNEYMKNSHLTDLRMIDRLVHKAEIERYNCERYHNNYEHIMNYLFKENIEPKPADFLSKFFAGKD